MNGGTSPEKQENWIIHTSLYAKNVTMLCEIMVLQTISLKTAATVGLHNSDGTWLSAIE
jgi:hypothetical protein